jgi:hypothetical protein
MNFVSEKQAFETWAMPHIEGCDRYICIGNKHDLKDIKSAVTEENKKYHLGHLVIEIVKSTDDDVLFAKFRYVGLEYDGIIWSVPVVLGTDNNLYILRPNNKDVEVYNKHWKMHVLK